MRVTKNSRLIIILAIWAVIHVFLFFHFGIVTKGEAEKYISEAQNLVNGRSLSSPNFILYSVQILLLYISLKFHLGYLFVVCVQIVFSLLATLSFYRLTTHLFHPAISFISTIWFLCNLPLHQFNVFLQTDSLFYSFTIIFSCYVLQISSLSWRRLAALTALLMLISLTRPTGVFFIPATFLYLYFRLLPRLGVRYKAVLLFTITTLFFYILNWAIGSGGELDFMLPARDERIICGVPTLPQFVQINEVKNGNSIYGLFYYITHNFNQFSRLAFQRSLAFFSLFRSHYSFFHFAYLVLLFYPAYILIVVSVKYWWKQRRLVALYIFTLVLLTWVTVILSCDDWHNRFYLTITPYLNILALPAVEKLMSKSVFNERHL